VALSAIPAAPPPPAVFRPRSSVLRRRRGAQPANLNALRHGYYSARQPHSAALALQDLRLSKRLLSATTPVGADLRDRPELDLRPALSPGRLLDYSARLLDRTYADIRSARIGDKAWLFHQGLFLQAVSLDIYIKGRLFKLHQETHLLQTIAARAADLYNWEFQRKGLRPYPLPPYPVQKSFVPPTLRKKSAISGLAAASHQNPPLFSEKMGEGREGASVVPFLTDSQWTLLQPLLTTLRQHQSRQRKYRLKPRWDDRLLLDAILCKLATACRWEDLPSSSLIRACQTLYRQLCLSGRMASIYTLLHQHLEEVCAENLRALTRQSPPLNSQNLGEGREGAERQAFQILNNRVTLASSVSPTWQQRTALLLLQRALFNYRAQKRDRDLERRHCGRSLRLPAMRLQSMRPRHYHRTPPSSFPLSSFLRVPEPAQSASEVCPWWSEDFSPPIPRNAANLPPLESTLAYRKWRHLNRTDRILRANLPSPPRPPPNT